MPLSKYYKGHGEKVMADMTRRYGPVKGERVFYATANAKKKKLKNKGGVTATVATIPAGPRTGNVKKRRKKEKMRPKGYHGLPPRPGFYLPHQKRQIV